MVSDGSRERSCLAARRDTSLEKTPHLWGFTQTSDPPLSPQCVLSSLFVSVLVPSFTALIKITCRSIETSLFSSHSQSILRRPCPCHRRRWWHCSLGGRWCTSRSGSSLYPRALGSSWLLREAGREMGWKSYSIIPPPRNTLTAPRNMLTAPRDMIPALRDTITAPRDMDPAPREHTSLTPCTRGFEPLVLPAGFLGPTISQSPLQCLSPCVTGWMGTAGQMSWVSFFTEGVVSSLLVKSLYVPRNHRGAEELLGQQGARPVMSAQASACGIQV